MHCAEVAREPAKAQPQHPRSEVRRGALGQDEEPRVVGDEVKAAKLLLGQPPDPAVAGPELERTGVPTHERQPVLAQHCDVAHTSPDQAPEGQIVVRAHQRIPADPLVGAHRGADRDLAQPSGNQLEHRLRRGRWACAPLWRPRRHLSRDPVSPVASISYRPGKIGPVVAVDREIVAVARDLGLGHEETLVRPRPFALRLAVPPAGEDVSKVALLRLRCPLVVQRVAVRLHVVEPDVARASGVRLGEEAGWRWRPRRRV